MGVISRRNFLQAGAATAVLGVMPSLSSAKPEESAWDAEYDVLVVGSGVAGLTAAIMAAEAGNKTAILEKMPYTGGSSRISQCDMAIVGSPLQKKEGIEDKPEWLAADMVKVSGGMTDPEMALTIAKGTAGLLDFMVRRGVEFNDSLIHFGGHSAKRVMWPKGGGKGLIRPLQAHFTGLPGTTLSTRTKVDSLIRNESGRAVGLAVRENYLFNPSIPSDDENNATGTVRRYKARKGIVFASGGFCRDEGMRGTEAPYLRNISSNAHIGATGGALKALILGGAYPMHMSLFRFSFPISYTDIIWGMYVDPATGKRFANEMANRDVISMAILDQIKKNGGKTPVVVYDSECLKNFNDTRRLNRGLAGKNTCGGNIQEFPTLEALAKEYGIPLKPFLATVEHYNEMLKSGKDEEFNKDMLKMKGAGIMKPPFYAMQAVPFIAYTAGGVRITPSAEVVSLMDWKPIPGLYAAGEVTGGIHGANRLTSCSVIDCGVFGMIAGSAVSRMAPLQG